MAHGERETVWGSAWRLGDREQVNFLHFSKEYAHDVGYDILYDIFQNCCVLCINITTEVFSILC